MRERRPGVWEIRIAAGTDPVTGPTLRRSVTFRGGPGDAELKELLVRRAEAEGGAVSEVIRARSPPSSDVTAEALVTLRDLFTGRDHAEGIEMAMRAAGDPGSSEVLRVSIVALVTDLLAATGHVA